MVDIFKPINLDISNKAYNLDVQASGVVQSTKYFPVFLIDNSEYIFKPLSKTKPYTTPLFAYSECYWSYLINKCFDKNAPIYQLAYCHGLEKEQEKYYDYGTLVKSTVSKDEKLVNLLEYFNMYPDNFVNIKDYVNYCMITYDYTNILNSTVFKEHKFLSKQLAWQVLLSILRQDYNFHYENVNFIIKNNEIKTLNPPIDYEFSNIFLFADQPKLKEKYNTSWNNDLKLLNKEEHNKKVVSVMVTNNPLYLRSKNILNICAIVRLFPELVENFIVKLDDFRNEVQNLNITDDYNYITPCNSNSFLIGQAKYKALYLKEAERLKREIKLVNLDKSTLFEQIKKDTLKSSYDLEKILTIYLYAYKNGIEDLENFIYEDLEKILSSKHDIDSNNVKRILKL